MTGPLAQLVREHFAIEVDQVRALDVVAHNHHFVAAAPGGPFHLTLHDLPAGSPDIDQLEEVHRVVVRLAGPTTAVATTLRTGASGRYLEPTEFGHLTLRRHAGRTVRGLGAEQLVAVAREHSRALTAGVPRDARLRHGAPRFSASADTLEAADLAIETRLAHWIGPEHRSALRRVVDDVRRSSVADGSERLYPVHGDLEESNMLLVDDEIEVVDHGCMHWDHPLYDLAHLMLSSVAAGYYCGPLDRTRTNAFVAAVRAAEPHIVPQLLETGCYVMLEKLLDVDRERHVLVEHRLAAIDELRSLARTERRSSARVT